MRHTATIQGRRAAPHFRHLTVGECEAILRRAAIGRLAFSLHDKVDIEPIHFAYHDGWIVFRTSSGTKLDVITRNRWVALETDEVDGVFEWRSVVVHGAAYPLDENITRVLPDARDQAMRLLRRIVPSSGLPEDPAPWRDRVFHMQAADVTGRAATMSVRRVKRRPRSSAR